MLALMLLVSYSAFSQKPPPTPGNPPPPGLLISSGIPYLLLAGVIYGIRALKNKS